MYDVKLLFSNNTESVGNNETKNYDFLLSVVDSVLHINNQSGFVIDFDAHKIIYRTEKLVYVDESTSKDIQRECSNPYWSLVSDETLQALLSIRSNYIEVGKGLSMEEFRNHICMVDYPIILHGHELFLMQKFTPLVVRNDGIVSVGLFTICYSNRKEIDSLIITTGEKRYRYDFVNEKYIEYRFDLVLSSIEKAILHRAKQGMSIKDIAKSLFVSENTVKTHRMRIFKKLHVDSITQALAVVDNYQLI